MHAKTLTHAFSGVSYFSVEWSYFDLRIGLSKQSHIQSPASIVSGNTDIPRLAIRSVVPEMEFPLSLVVIVRRNVN